jgi:hypothetical protein
MVACNQHENENNVKSGINGGENIAKMTKKKIMKIWLAKESVAIGRKAKTMAAMASKIISWRKWRNGNNQQYIENVSMKASMSMWRK